jgi:hypothetical protein
MNRRLVEQVQKKEIHNDQLHDVPEEHMDVKPDRIQAAAQLVTYGIQRGDHGPVGSVGGQGREGRRVQKKRGYIDARYGFIVRNSMRIIEIEVVVEMIEVDNGQ